MVAGCVLAVLAALAGCGGSGGSTTKTTGTGAAKKTPASAPAKPYPAVRGPALDAAAQRYVSRANSACATARADIPPPLTSPYTADSVARYATAAGPPVRRTVLSLSRLKAPGQLRLAASGLVRAYGKLLPLFASVSQSGQITSPKTAAQQIQAREDTATALARAARLPDCRFATR